MRWATVSRGPYCRSSRGIWPRPRTPHLPACSEGLRDAASEIRGVVDVSVAFVFGDLRIRAERTRPVNPAAGTMRGDHRVRRFTVFDPLFKSSDFVEHIGTFATAAVSHS